MNELPLNMQKLINCYKPIETDGFTLYPITVANYAEFMVARRAIGFVQQTLPIELMSMPLLSALYKIDFERALKEEEPSGLFASALLSIALALRLNQGDEEATDIFKRLTIIADPHDQSKLKSINFTLDGIEEKSITPIQYARLRPIIAAQNGIKLASDLDNPELLQAEEDLADSNAPKLDYRTENLVYAAAALTGKDEEEIYGWAILKLTNRLSSFKRILDYVICGIGESQGTQWKGGNPHPHPWVDKITGMSAALMPMGDFMGGAGYQAMKDAGMDSSSAQI